MKAQSSRDVGFFFTGEESKLMCQTTFSHQHGHRLSKAAGELHAGKRINKPVTGVGKNP